MNEKLISTSSAQIRQAPESIWNALTQANLVRKYFFGAEVITTWKEGSPIIFRGNYKGNQYEEKGVILKVVKDQLLQYSHWSNFDGLPDLPENYRSWTFDLSTNDNETILTVTEDNIPTAEKKRRSDEFWKGWLNQLKSDLEK